MVAGFRARCRAQETARVKPWLESELTGLILRYGPQVGADRSGSAENLDAFRAVAQAAGRG